MSKEIQRYLLKRAISLHESIKLIYEYESRDQSPSSKFSGFPSHKTIAVQLTQLAIDIRKEFPDSNFYLYDTQTMKDAFNSVYMYRKSIIDGCFIEVGKMIAFLEAKLGEQEEEIKKIISLIKHNLRSIIRNIPNKEVEIQDKIEDLIIGYGMKKGTDFDRETGRVKTGVKESVPDFIFRTYDFCIEVKLIKGKNDPKKITEQINSDIIAYGKLHKNIFIIVYDSGGIIQNIEEFKYNIIGKNIFLEVIKH